MTKVLMRVSPALGLFTLVVGLALVAGGCDKPAATTPAEKKDDTVKGKGDPKHGEWWCEEHGIPEEECSMCDEKYAQQCKDKKDWCAKHDRADSQCFVCHPENKEKFAAKYRAKYGKEPPPISEPLPTK